MLDTGYASVPSTNTLAKKSTLTSVGRSTIGLKPSIASRPHRKPTKLTDRRGAACGVSRGLSWPQRFPALRRHRGKDGTGHQHRRDRFCIWPATTYSPEFHSCPSLVLAGSAA